MSICTCMFKLISLNRNLRRRIHGRNDDNDISQLKRTYYKFKKQVRITLLLLVLGGVDGTINLVAIVIMIIVNRVLSASHMRYFLQFVINPLLYVQMILHSLLYGIYMKDIRRLCKCQLYQRLWRRCPLHPSKVTVLHQSKFIYLKFHRYCILIYIIILLFILVISYILHYCIHT